jgi:hypothetical protein
VASSTAPLSAEILANWSLDVEAVLTQILLVVLVGAFLALGLLARSRVAFGLGFAIGLAAVAWWLDLLVSKDPAALHRLAVLIGASGLLVVTGLLLDLPAFLQRPTGESGDPTSINPRRAADRAWRPPR